jgi:hypothetical protein
MKGLKTLAVVALASGLLATAMPATAGAAAYKHYVACGVSAKSKPSHVCSKKEKKGAFFKSFNAAVYYSVCVRFPSGKTLCANKQPQKESPKQGTLYVNSIQSTSPGKHVVSWYVKGKKVGSWIFRVRG